MLIIRLVNIIYRLNLLKIIKIQNVYFKMDNKEKGRIGLITAISYFGLNGYTINIPLNDTQ